LKPGRRGDEFPAKMASALHEDRAACHHLPMAPRARPVYTPPGGPPGVERPSGAILEALGEEGVFALLEAFYLELERSELRPLFPPDVRAASRRSAAFFVQLLGGRPLFSEAFGPPRMRARHLPFEIDGRAREVWLDCFRRTLAAEGPALGFPAEHLAGFVAFLEGFSSWMVNVAPE
jgi:hemoglobin